MMWPSKKERARQRMNKTIGLNMQGRAEPELYRVCDDVYMIIEKMLRANSAIGPFSRHPQFDFEEVLFVLSLLGASINETHLPDHSSVDLWISEG